MMRNAMAAVAAAAAAAALAMAVPAGAASPAKPPAKVKKAPSKPAEPALDPDLKAAAAQVVKLTGVEETNDRNLSDQAQELRTGTLVQQEVDRSPEMKAARTADPAAWALVMKRFGERQADILEEVKAPAEAEFHDRLVRAYATHFTLDELKALADFYATPVGQKLVATVPPIMAENMAWLQDAIGERMGPRIKGLRDDFRQAVTPLMAGTATRSDER